MKTATKKKVLFTTREQLLARMKEKRPDLLQAVLNEPLRVVVGKNLLRLRSEAGLSREALAARCEDVGERTIQRIEECGEDSNPTVRVIEHLSRALKVSSTALTDPRATFMGGSF
jgi:ribosome-binding protein aMBF1 (putative translation factor)